MDIQGVLISGIGCPKLFTNCTYIITNSNQTVTNSILDLRKGLYVIPSYSFNPTYSPL